MRLDKIALEPWAEYERWPDGNGGGVEDPRITAIEGAYYMAYTAYGDAGGVIMPRIALARSDDLFEWERLGLAEFSAPGVEDSKGQVYDWAQVPNKTRSCSPNASAGGIA